ncbi:phosphatidylserine decarboxylase [Croceitalea rosinachiae]|uniref:Phosphatidylserine decarboxylase n=1 Tax=Croceitalea rosinachiae TaxID=3075596 RepID=A0ABU3ACC5_9FLAO|nr:phosphatidylserine decarboxylase [Croceitalea sp. F388]MDT0607530.1 phosphatidylserine decarboxylase [Croceitalea sp. F388]
METASPYYSDPSFTIFKVPRWRAYFYKFLSVNVWGAVPSNLQRSISAWYSNFYNTKASKHIIKPYIKLNYTDKDYLDKFKPPFGKSSFDTFQDFFTREFKSLPISKSNTVWPCEGLLCEEGKVDSIKNVHVKYDIKTVDTVFGLKKNSIPKDYTFTNVFLHNKNYHRIHAPIDGTITRIQHVPGDLVVLRPWIYKQNPSLPAFRNERCNIDITDTKGKIWYLSIVGGPAVGTIELGNDIFEGAKVKKLNELALFHLGSTCCMASPLTPRFHSMNTFVEMGSTY